MAPQKEHNVRKTEQRKKQATSGRSQNRIKEVDARKDHNTDSSQLGFPLQLAQEVLDTFVGAFPHLLEPSTDDKVLLPLLQKIKAHLFNRDFDAAFGCNEFLEAYIARWSPSRALCYGQVFSEVFRVLTEQFEDAHVGTPNIDGSASPSKQAHVTCLGGGAAELVGLATALQLSNPGFLNLQVTLIDRANWSGPLETLYKSMNKLSSATSLQQSSMPIVSGVDASVPKLNPNYSFHQMDLLNLSLADGQSFDEQIRNSTLITLMFTLNELYSSSIASTQSMLLHITSLASSGTLLLVVDSAGSYSTVTMNQKEKKYPMQWLLDYTLIKFAPKTFAASDNKHITSQEEESNLLGKVRNEADVPSERPLWELVKSTDSQWYRLPDVTYPMELENMRYQQHLYRRV